MNMDTGCWGQHVMAKHRNYFDATFAVHSTLLMHISSIISTMVSYTSANGYPFIYSSSLYKGMGVISDSMSALFLHKSNSGTWDCLTIKLATKFDRIKMKEEPEP